jgi:hypothetical protein
LQEQYVLVKIPAFFLGQQLAARSVYIWRLRARRVRARDEQSFDD